MVVAHDLRLAPAALGAYASAALVIADAHAVWWALVAGVAVVAGVTRQPILVLAAVAVLVVGGTTAWHAHSRWHGEFDAALGEHVTLRATVARDAHPTAGSVGASAWRAAVDVTAWEHPREGWVAAQARVVMLGDDAVAHLRHGDTIEVSGRLLALEGQWEAGLLLESQLLTEAPPTGMSAAVASARQGLRDVTESLPDLTRGLVRGMVIGDTSTMPPAQRTAMRTTSLAHLTAVSGAHFAIVLMASAGLMRLWRWPRRVRAGCAAVLMALFATMVLPEPSVVRALTMALAVCAALWWGRPAHAMPALGMGVMVLMTLMPHLALSYGFALSVTAVTAIVMWSPVLTVHLQRWVPPLLAKAVAVPVAAQLACAPILVLLNPGLGPLGPLANLVAALFAVPVTLIGLVALVTAMVNPTVAEVLAVVAGWSAWPIAQVSLVLGNSPGSWVHWPGGLAGAGLMILVSVTAIVATSWRTPHPRWRIGGAAVVIGAVVLSPPVATSGGWAPAPMPQWQVVVCDVGQGDMTLLRAGPRAAVVIDVGSAGAGGTECLRRHRVEMVPLLILTHPHEDHDGATAEVLGAVEVGHAWVTQAGRQDGLNRAVVALDDVGVSVSVPRPGQQVEVGWVQLDVWHPSPRSRRVSPNELNDASIVVWAATADVSVIALGDIETAGQSELARRLPSVVTVDVLKAAHHGSSVQLPDFVERFHAAVVVFSAGHDNRHGHPTDVALELYGRNGAVVSRTDTCGDIVVGRANGALEMLPCR